MNDDAVKVETTDEHGQYAAVWFSQDASGIWLASGHEGDPRVAEDLIFVGEELHQQDFLDWAGEYPRADWIGNLEEEIKENK